MAKKDEEKVIEQPEGVTLDPVKQGSTTADPTAGSSGQENFEERVQQEVAKRVAEEVEKAVAQEMAKYDKAQAVCTTMKAAATSTQSEAEELVEIRINKDRKDQTDVTVSVNGKVYRIKRGEKVKVPKYIVAVLENMRKMDELRIERMEQATKNFNN